MTAEMDIQNSIRLALAKKGHYVFRANVGKIRMPNGRILTQVYQRGFQIYSVFVGRMEKCSLLK